MNKSMLQDLCHQQNWPKPSYTTTKHDLDHCSPFTASVVVNGLSFTTGPYFFRSPKEACNFVARQALEHFTQSSKLAQMYQSQVYAKKQDLVLPEYAKKRKMQL
ncbi:hypothetical protein ACFE04_020736 [Oxalis oulophora]